MHGGEKFLLTHVSLDSARHKDDLMDYTDMEEIRQHEYETGWMDWLYGIHRPAVLSCFGAYRVGFMDAARSTCDWR